MYFYELHESDDDLFTDVLLAHDVEYDEDEFMELVTEARRSVIARFEENSLVEAVANEMQRRHGFIHIDDRQLRVAVNVSMNEENNFVAPTEEGGRGDDPDGYRSLLVELDPEDRN